MSIKKANKHQVNWQKWHDGIKKELKQLLSVGVELEKMHHIGAEQPWGHLDSYKPDVKWRKDSRLYFFEAEYWYEQEKIIADILYAALLGANHLVFIFGNEEYQGWDGRKRAQASEYLFEQLQNKTQNLPIVNCTFVDNIEELEQKLKEIGVL